MKYAFILLLVTLILSANSCKQPLPGCTDLSAENYDGLAEEDDGTCSYRGSAVFYHGEQTSENLVAAGVTNVKLYVDGDFWDAMSPNVYFSFEPTCEHPDAMTVENYGLGGNPSQSFGYRITDQDENILDEGTFTISGNECNRIEYQY